MKSISFLSLLVVFLCVTVCLESSLSYAADKPKTETKKPKANLRGFKKIVKPFLKEHCYKCHSGETKKKDLDLEKINGDMIKGDDAEKWRTVFDSLRAKEMPPEKEPRPDEKKQEKVLEWISDELERVPEKK